MAPAGWRGLGDRIIALVSRAAMHGWFRSIEVSGIERLSAAGPMVVVATHGNGFVDPALLAATSPRAMRFLAKATLWKLPPVGWLLDIVGALPVHEADAASTQGNRQTFCACYEELRHGGAVALFPEGTTHADLRLRRLHTGAARIALGARAVGAEGLRIVPVGLLYEQDAAPRSRALVRVGGPIDLDTAVDRIVAGAEADGEAIGETVEDDRAVARRLTAEITHALGAAGLDYADREGAMALFLAVRTYLAEEVTQVRELPLSLLEPLVRRLSQAPAEHREAVVEALARYQLHLDLFGLEDDQVLAGAPGRRLRTRPGQRAVAATLLTPAAAAGIAVNVLPWLLVDRLSNRPMARVSRANFTLLASVAAYPPAWLATGLVLRRLGVRHPWSWAMAVGPVGGQAAVAWWELVGDMRRARLGWRQVLRNADALDALRERRARLVEAVAAALNASEAPTPTTDGGPSPAGAPAGRTTR